PLPRNFCRFLVERIRPPARSNVFPYTTLFRSDRRHDVHPRDVLDAIPLHEERVGAELPHPVRGDHERQEAVEEEKLGADALFVKDRKSTRLNSSHVKISYAVFCLKKNNKTSYL